jgi:hypothetical protein
VVKISREGGGMTSGIFLGHDCERKCMYVQWRESFSVFDCAVYACAYVVWDTVGRDLEERHYHTHIQAHTYT